jgi:hypothetical protein
MNSVKAFLSRFFWGLVSNSDSDVSNGAVLATLLILAWIAMYLWCQLHERALRVSPAEILILAGGLYAIPKVPRGGNK